MRYIVGMIPFGSNFLNGIQDLDLGNSYVSDPNKQRSMQDVVDAQNFIFRECAVQISNLLTADAATYFRQIQMLPDLKHFKHIGEVMEHGPRQLAFIHLFREFAVQFYFAVNKYVPLYLQKDYIVEGIHPSYVVLREAVAPVMEDMF